MLGQNILLRALEPTDIDLLYSLENDMKLWHLSSTITPFSRFVLEQYLVNAHEDIFTTKQLRLVIETTVSSGIQAGTAGLIDLYDFDPINLRAGIGIIIKEELRGKKFATEALELLKIYAFKTLNLVQLYAGIPENNTASIRLFGKAGFIKTGIRKRWIRNEEQWLDEHFFQLLKS
jgi:diamine N-acetyltransferase